MFPVYILGWSDCTFFQQITPVPNADVGYLWPQTRYKIFSKSNDIFPSRLDSKVEKIWSKNIHFDRGALFNMSAYDETELLFFFSFVSKNKISSMEFYIFQFGAQPHAGQSFEYFMQNTSKCKKSQKIKNPILGNGTICPLSNTH